VNILAVFLLSGLWHGAAWNFVAWGLFLGVGYLLEGFAFPPKPSPKPLRAVLGNLWAVGMFAGSMFFFRAQSLTHTTTLLQHAGQGGPLTLPSSAPGTDWGLSAVLHPNQGLMLLALLAALWGLDAAIGKQNFSAFTDKLPRPLRWGLYYVLLASILLLGAYGKPVPFLYFQF
jgi:hypothetical protein